MNKLEGTIPGEMSNITSLEVLDISVNFLSGTIPDSIGSMKQLMNLVLSANHLVGSIPKTIGKLSLLTHLALGSNYFYGPLPAELVLLTNLRILQISQNYFSGALPDQLDNLSLLDTLDVSQNNFSYSIPSKIGYLSSITFLDLSSNFFSGLVPVESCDLLPSLHFLNLCVYSRVGCPYLVAIPACLIKVPNTLYGSLPVYYSVPSLTSLPSQDSSTLVPTSSKEGASFEYWCIAIAGFIVASLLIYSIPRVQSYFRKFFPTRLPVDEALEIDLDSFASSSTSSTINPSTLSIENSSSGTLGYYSVV